MLLNDESEVQIYYMQCRLFVIYMEACVITYPYVSLDGVQSTRWEMANKLKVGTPANRNERVLSLFPLCSFEWLELSPRTATF